MNDYFKKGEKRYNKYIDCLKEIGIYEKNISVLDCYGMSKEIINKEIEESDILLLTGGNPEMLYNKIVQKCEVLYTIKHYPNIIIGESAGALLQFDRYFITARNNFYKYFAFYDGLGYLGDRNYNIVVHSINNKKYLDKLKRVSKESKKTIYAIHDDGALLINRNTDDIKCYGDVNIID